MRGARELFCRIRFLDANYDAAFACGGRLCLGLNCEEFAARTGGEPVIAALKGERVNQLHRCAVRWDYRGRRRGLASFRDVRFSFGSSLLCVNSLFETRASDRVRSCNLNCWRGYYPVASAPATDSDACDFWDQLVTLVTFRY